VHVIGPEFGLTHPGSLIVCGDSHTSTHGAFGALAFGIGSTELGHVLATQCLLQRKPRNLLVQVDGRLRAPATAKDLVLAIIRELGAAGGTGSAIEYRGPGIEALSMEERMTVCNMSIEAGARSGIIAPDEVTFAYLRGRPRAPQGAEWDRAVAHWRTLRSDEGARFDRVLRIDASSVRPTMTWGTSPAQSVSIGEAVPLPADGATRSALAYMGLQPGKSMVGLPVQVVFVGSCTNGRLSDLRAAASVLKGRRVAPGLRMLVVPGSQAIKREAEQEGLDVVFRAAGAEWRESGCSMCNGINEDRVPAGAYCVSTSNRNFAGRQGVGSRTLLASPVVAAACAVAGKVVDPAEIAA
jgi:3-isopropylmalate/(R)-2-methylmalate dehydratase large subunit